jgi:hypothetical protein
LMDTIITIAAIDPTGTPETLRYSEAGYTDSSARFYPPVIAQSALVSVIPNDGGILSVLKGASVGDVVLVNENGGLDVLDGYGLDGGDIVISFFDGASLIERFRGIVGRAYNAGATYVINIKAPQEALKNNHPLATFAGDNVPPMGLAGTADTIKDNSKPRFYGDCRNISPINVNPSLQIYQANDRSDCVITAVYIDGVRLVNYRTHAAHELGATAIAVAWGLGDIPTGGTIMFDGHATLYDVTDGLDAGVITITPGLTQAVPLKAAVEVVGFYVDTTDLQGVDYSIDGDHATGDTIINVTGGLGAISVDDTVMFSGHLAIYTVTAALSGGAFTLQGGLLQDVADGELVYVLGVTQPVLWGGFQGYFRLSVQASGTVTCDAITVSGGAVLGAGDVLERVADEAGLTVASSAVANFNAAGIIGLFVNAQVSTEDLFNRIARSVAGYWWISGGELQADLLALPSGSAAWDIADWQIIDMTKDAAGLGSNGLPVHQLTVQHDRIETVQDTVAGVVAPYFRQRLKSQYRDLTVNDAAVLTQHRGALPMSVESFLRTRAQTNTMASRLFALVKSDRVPYRVTIATGQAGALTIGAVLAVMTPRFNLDAGRDMVLMGYELDDDKRTVAMVLL